MPYRFGFPLDHPVVFATTNNLEEDFELDKGLDRDTPFRLTIGTGTQEIGGFRLAPMPGCCGIVVVHNMFLAPQWRGSAYRQEIRDLKTTLCRRLGYTLMIATTRMDQVASVGNMIRSGYKIIETFTNSRTNHLIGVGTKKL